MKETNDPFITLSIDVPKLSEGKASAGSDGSKSSDTSAPCKSVVDKEKNTVCNQDIQQEVLKKKQFLKMASEMTKTVVARRHLFRSPKMTPWIAAGFWSKVYLLRVIVSFILVLSVFSVVFAAVFRFGAYKINPFLAEVTTENPGYLTSNMNFLETVVVLPAFAVLLLDFQLLMCIRKDTITQMLPLLESWTCIVDLMASINLLTVPLYTGAHKADFHDSLKCKAAGFAFLMIILLKIFLGMQRSILENLKDMTVNERRLTASAQSLLYSRSWSCCRLSSSLNTLVTVLCGMAFVLLQTTELQYGAPLLGCVGDDCPRLRVPAVVYYSTCSIVLANFLYGCAHWPYWHPNPASIRLDHLNRVVLTGLLALIPLPCGYLCQLYRLAVPYTVWGGVFALSLASLLLIALDMMRAFPPASSSSALHKLDFFVGAKGCNLRNSPAAAVEMLKSLRNQHASKDSIKDQLIDTSAANKQDAQDKATTVVAKSTSSSAKISQEVWNAIAKEDLKRLASNPGRIVAGKMFYVVLFLRLLSIAAAAVLTAPVFIKMNQQEELNNLEVVTLAFFFYHSLTILSLVLSLSFDSEPFVIHDLKSRLIKFLVLEFIAIVTIMLKFSFAFLFAGFIPTFLDVAYEIYWNICDIVKAMFPCSTQKDSKSWCDRLRKMCCKTMKRSSSPAPPRAKGKETGDAVADDASV